jgi:type IV pilus assembly protein PilB
VGIHELLVLNDELRDAITANATLNKIREVASRDGLPTLAQDGFRKVREGITTIDEVMQAVGDCGFTLGSTAKSST